MRGPNGETVAADEAYIQAWVNQGYRPISEGELGAELAARAERPEDRGLLGDVNAAVTGALSGMTLGASDVVLGGVMTRGQRERLLGDIEHAPVASTAGRIVGEVLPAFATGGESLVARGLTKTPAGQLARLSTAVGEAIPGTGAIARVGRLAATGGTEGAISNAGQYLGAMALQDKEASAQGFLASMKDGALYGGGAAGALGIAGEGLIAARRLLPDTELTPIAARRAREAAVQEVSRATDETRELEVVGRARARRIREDAVAADPALRAELDKIAVQKARDLADADVRTARAKAEAAEARAMRAKEPRKRKVKAEEAPSATDTPLADEGPPSPIDLDAEIRSAIKAGEVPGEVGPFTPYGLDLAVEREMKRRGIPTPEPGTELFQQLKGTQAAIESGTPLSKLSARRKEQLVEDALNARVAEQSPEMDRLLRHLNGLTNARDQVAAWLDKYPTGKVKSFEYTEGMRKQSGWRDILPQDSQRPGFAEGSLSVPRGRQGEFLGDEAARQSFERGVTRRDLRRRIDDPLASPAEKAEAQSILSQMDADSEARRTAKQIVDASDEQIAAQGPAAIDEHVERALNGNATLTDDVDDATEAIGSLEQSAADLADELGIDAPPTSAERAQRFRQAQTGADESAAKAAEDAVMDAERAAKTIGLGDTPQAKKGRGLLATAEQAGQILEALELLGIPVPSASRLPVVGPLLSLYLKAKLAHRAVTRLGGKVPRTAETEIARRSADTKARLIRAADRVLAGAGRAATSARAAAAIGAGASSVLGAKLFDDRDPATPEKRTTPTDDLQEIYLVRRDELERAMVPGAIRESVRRRVRTADIALLDAIAEAEERKLKFLYDKMPKTDDGVQILGKRTLRAPARADMEQWAKYVAAANRPVETMEAILDGKIVSAEAAETIRVVYPRLMQDVQDRIVEKAVESDVRLPYKRKVHLSMTFGLPLDDSQSPESAAFMSTMYQPAQPAPPAPQPGPIVSRQAERVDPEANT